MLSLKVGCLPHKPSPKRSGRISVKPDLKPYVNVTNHCAPLSVQKMSDCACGGGCPRCQGGHWVQAKLKIGASTDKYEQEADRIADSVMSVPQSAILGKPG